MTKIYESPDRGKTIYARDFGSIERELIHEHEDMSVYGSIVQKMQHEKLWEEIHAEAKHNPALQDALNQCIMIYKLSKEYKDV